MVDPKGEFYNRLKRLLDSSNNVSESVKRDVGKSPVTTVPFVPLIPDPKVLQKVLKQNKSNLLKIFDKYLYKI